MWHCALVSCTPPQTIGLFFGVFAVLVLSVIMCSFNYFPERILFHHDFHNFSCHFYWFLWPIISFLTTRLCFLYLSSFCSVNAQIPGCFHPLTFSLNTGLNMLPSNCFMSCLHSLLGYSTGDFQALQLILFAAFNAVDWLLASCTLVHFSEI